MRRIFYNLIAVLFLFFLCAQTVASNEDVQVKAQFEVSKSALFDGGSSEKNRVNAAVLLLLRKEPQARDILLSALSDSNNPIPKIAVCKALNQSTTWVESIYNKEDFIVPLLSVLGGDQEGKAAAEALLIYDYKEISDQLIKIIKDNKAEKKKRLDAVYALRLRPDKEAMLKLIELVDEGDADVSAAAAQALEKLLGVPAGADKAEWQRISAELKKKSRDEFVSDRLIRQYDKVRALEEELAGWKQLYFNALNKFYDQLIEDDVKQRFLADQLGDSREEIILWSLEKLESWIKSGKAVSADVCKPLLDQVSSRYRNVRLWVAKLLASLGYTAPSEALLAQLKVETDPSVKMEQFKALGEAIYFGLSPGSQVKIDNQVRIDTLGIASGYLNSDKLNDSITAAKVIQKLLEQNGLEHSVAKSYFQEISDRYSKIPPEKAAERGEFASVMSRLSQNSSFYRVDAAAIFKPLFEKGLSENGLLVKQSSMNGLENIDPVGALKIFRDLKLYNDPTESIRVGVYDLAEQVGGNEDLAWLVEKLPSNGDSEVAWRVFSAVAERLDGDINLKWLEKIDKGQVNVDHYLRYLSLVENKLQQAKKDLPLTLKIEKAQILKDKGDLDNSLSYYNACLADANNISADQKDVVCSEMAGVYIAKQDFANAGDKISKLLASRDLTEDDYLAVYISNFIKNESVEPDAKASFLGVIGSLQVAERPVWSSMMAKWSKLASPNDPNSPPAVTNKQKKPSQSEKN